MSPRSALRTALPGLTVAVGLLALQLAYDVPLIDAVTYAGYELGFVVVPGWLAYRALSSEPGGALRQLALGWALGYALEIAAFMVTAATGTRALFVAYPIIVGVVALATIAHKRRRATAAAAPSDEAEARPDPRLGWLIAAVCLLAALYVGIAYFYQPLPGGQSVHYAQDQPWHLALAADLKHHWPMEDPQVSGEPLPYHNFIHMHMAAAGDVTGIDLSLIYFRLFITPLVVLVVLLMVVAGKSLTGSSRAGLVGACLAFLVGQLTATFDTPSVVDPFKGVFFTFLYASPSFLLGLAMLTALLTLVGERIVRGRGPGSAGDWIVLALVILGASNAKVTVLPMLLAALILYAIWSWWAERSVPRAVWGAGALLLLGLVAVYALQYKGRSSGLTLDLTAGVDFFNNMAAVVLVKSEVEGAFSDVPGGSAALSALGVVFGAIGLFAAQLAGLRWFLQRRGRRLLAADVWLLAVTAVGLAVVLTTVSPGTGNELYFLFAAVVPACLLSGHGLWMTWGERPALDRTTKRRALALFLGWIGIMLVLSAAPFGIDPAEDLGSAYLFWYTGLLLSVALLYVLARRWVGQTRWPAIALVSGALLLVGVLDTPLNKLEPALSRPTTAEEGRRLTPELYDALTWIRDNTPTDAVVAVNNGEALEFNHAAFSERRMFLGGWAYTLRIRETGYESVAPGFTVGSAGLAGVEQFADRLLLNDAVFKRGDAGALQAMIDGYGVRYLLVDEVNGYPVNMPALMRLGRPVYQAPGVTVLEVPLSGT